jgi:hypothetical protein
MPTAAEMLSTQKVKPPHIIIYGQPGTGKTAWAMTVGERGTMLDLDGGYVTATTLYDQHREKRLKCNIELFKPESPTDYGMFNKVKARVHQIYEQVRTKNPAAPKILIVDTLTALNAAAERQVVPVGQAKIQDWGMIINEILQVTQMLSWLDIPVILLAHQQSQMTDDNELISIGVAGKHTGKNIVAGFDELWYSKVVRDPVKAGAPAQYVLQTRPTAQVVVRSRYNPPDPIPMSIPADVVIDALCAGKVGDIK